MKLRKVLKLVIKVVLIWLVLFLTINSISLIELTKFLIANNNYQYESDNPVPIDSDYSILYDFVKLGLARENVPNEFTVDEPLYQRDLWHWDKNNYYRMRFILNYLDSIGVDYDTVRIANRTRRPVYSCNILINECKRDSITLITAHYDNIRRRNYQGALDNSAAVSILLNVINKSKDILKEKNVAFLLTTWEEDGLIGAKEFIKHTEDNELHIKKVICLDGIGRGELSTMNNSNGSFGFIFYNLRFKKKLFTGSKFINCPDYQRFDKDVIDIRKYNIKKLRPFLSSTDGRVFSRRGIPTVHLTSDDITHFLKVMHWSSDKVECLHYNSLLKCEDILLDYVKNLD